ncbi:MAG: phosphotransferase [Candidatus Poribacteria bacterium]
MDYVVYAAEQALESHGVRGARIEDSRVGAMMYTGFTINKLRAVARTGESYLVSVNSPHASVRPHVRIDDKLGIIRSHLLWLESLARGSGIAVQAPVRNRDHDLVTFVDAPGEDPRTACTVVKWVDGGELHGEDEEPPSPDVAERMGVLLARLHVHAAEWEMPADFKRHRHGLARITKSFGRLRRMVDGGQLSRDHHDRLTAVRERIDETVTALGESRAVWGVTHGDFHSGNCVIHEGGVRPIDFDFCYLGHYMRDIAYCFTLVTSGDEERDGGFRSAFWHGYVSTRSVSELEREALEAYTIEVGVDFWGERPSDDDGRTALATLAESPCDAFLNGRRHLSI